MGVFQLLNMQDYDQARREFDWNVPEYFNFATDVVDKWAQDRTKLALVLVNDANQRHSYTFWDMKCASSQLANLLEANGVTKGDSAMVLLPRCAAWWISMVGMSRCGVVPGPGTTQLTARDIKFRISAMGAKVVVTDISNVEKIDSIAFECPTLTTKIVVGGRHPSWIPFDEALEKESRHYEAPPIFSSDPAIIYFTSGTTGYPKMVLHSSASYPYAHKVTGEFWLDLTPNDLHCNLSDTGWGKAAWSSLYGPWNQGAALLAHEASGKFDPLRTLEVISQAGATVLCAAPTAFRLFVQEDLSKVDLSELRHCVSAGEPLNPEVMSAWKSATGLTIRDGYGQTECVLLMASFACLPSKPGSMGKPAPGFEVAVVDENAKPLPAGEEGELAIRVRPNRPAGLFVEYMNDAEATRARHMGDYYLTGDRVYMDDDGYYWFVGRADDVIISSGYRIGPFEVESALIEHPAVVEAAVVSSPDDVRGEIVKAFIILSSRYQASAELTRELQNHVKRVTAPYKYPRSIEFVTELPKTVSGKIRRVELRDREWAEWRQEKGIRVHAGKVQGSE